MTLRRCATGALLAVALPMTVAAETIMVRPFGPHIFRKPDLAKFVAANAEPQKISFADQVHPEQTTPRRIITHLCGSFQLVYFEQMLEQNPASRQVISSPETVLGPMASSLNWPACLYVNVPSPPGLRTRVRSTEKSVSEVYERLTGGAGGPEAMKVLFKPSIDKGVNIDKVSPGAELFAQFATRPTLLTPRAGVDDFVNGLTRSAGGAAAALAMFKVVPSTGTSEGSIVLSETGTDCNATGSEPFNATAVSQAYRYSQGLQTANNIDFQRTPVFVVDNGFLGGDPRLPRVDWFKGSGFNEKFFAFDNDGLARALPVVERRISPWNWEIVQVPDHESGHGTHVVGLTLGGPAFATIRDKLTLDGRPWSSITILNIGQGKKDLTRNAEQLLPRELPESGAIVNLSISYQNPSADVRSMFDSLFRKGGNLFVTAAGNYYARDAANYYPAAAGGHNSGSVITVAALDGSGEKLADFSSVGPDTVEIAAPGCEVESWIDNQDRKIGLSGTSQATPLVTFAASLLQSLGGKAMTPRELKIRLITAGDLLAPAEEGRTLWHVKLNVPKTLFLFNDYVRLREGDQAAEYLGSVQRLSGLSCRGSELGWANLWSLKRGQVKLRSYVGKLSGNLKSMCESQIGAGGTVVFEPSHRLDELGTPVPVTDPKPMPIKLADIDELVAAWKRSR